MNKDFKVGIVDYEYYLPEKTISSKELSEIVNIPVPVLEEKMGIKRKFVGGENDHPGEMAVKASKKLLERTGINPKEIDLILYTGETYAEHTCWTVGIYIQKEIGATVDSCYAFDLSFRCAGAPLGLKVAKEMMYADSSLKTVLIAGGNANANIINLKDPNQSFMFNMSPSGFAAIVKRDYHKNIILESGIVTDPAFAEDVMGYYGGTKNHLTMEMVQEIVKNPDLLDEINYLKLSDPEGMKERLKERSLPDFTSAVKKASDKSGIDAGEIDFLAMVATNPRAHFGIMEALHIDKEKTEYLYDYGHCGHSDNWITLDLGLKSGKVKDGSLVCMLGAGTGYAFSSTIIQWGECKN